MTDRFVDNATPGSNTSPYDTWAKAATLLANVDAVDAAGDRVFIASTHNETTAANVTFAGAGTPASPVLLLSVTAGTSTLASGAQVGTDAAGAAYAFNGSWYIQGVTFFAGHNGVSVSGYIQLDPGVGGNCVTAKDCTFDLRDNHTVNNIQVGPTTQLNRLGGRMIFENPTFRFSAAGQSISCGEALIEVRGGQFSNNGGANYVGPIFTGFGGGYGQYGDLLVDGFDFSNASTSMNIVKASELSSGYRCVLRNCKLPASWTGGLISGTFGGPARAEMYNCDSAGTNYRLWIEDYFGTIKDQTGSLVRANGATDGVTPLSWKVASNANAGYPVGALTSHEIVRRYPGTDAEDAAFVPGASVTVTVDLLHDSATNLKNDEIWLEVRCLGNAGVPESTIVNNARTILATAADQPASTASWDATGMSNPNRQKLSVTVTPQLRGFIHAVVYLAKASKTVYVDPALQLS